MLTLFRRWGRGYGLLALCALALAFLGARPAGASTRATGATVNYPAGWNLVALPTAQLLDQALPPLYAFGPNSTNYQPIGPGDAVGGRAVWAYFPHNVLVTLGATASEYTRVLATPGAWALVGDPSTSQSEQVTGADAVEVYDSVQGYTQVSELKPGQGGWALRFDAGAIFLGTAPRASGESAVQTAQNTLSSNPTDQGTFDNVAATTGEMITSRQYSAAQSTADDLRSADDDGLRSQGSSTLPPLSESQRADAATVRQDLAMAQAASSSGDNATADSAIADARTAAQASQDDAANQAQQQGTSSSAVYASAKATPANLVRFGLLARAGFLGLALGVPLSTYYRNLETAVLTGSPLPPPLAGSTPATTTATAAASSAPSITGPSCDNTTINAGSSVNCSAQVRGPVTAITWSVPGGNPASGSGVTFGTEFDQQGRYTLSVQACNGSSCASQSASIQVGAGAPPVTTPTATPTVVSLGPTALSGAFGITQQDAGGCNYSRGPQTSGVIVINVTLNAPAGTPTSASGTLNGGGSGSKQITCNGVSGTMSWSQQYSGQFVGTMDPGSGRVTMSGTFTGDQSVSYQNCTMLTTVNNQSHSTPTQCPSDTQPQHYSYSIAVTGSIDPKSGLGSGQISFSNISLPTSGQWTVSH